MFGDKVYIKDINGIPEVCSSFTDIYDDRTYTVIDKFSLAETIGKKILDNIPDFNIDNQYDIIYEEIDSAITNEITNDIYSYVQNYLEKNI